MRKFLLYLSALVLIALALLTGGCSLFFAPEMLNGTAGGVGGLWIAGFAVAAVSIWLALRAFRAARK